MVIYYRDGNPEQIKRYAKNVEVRRYKEGEIIECNRFFCCYNPDILDFVNAKEYIGLIHCDYKNVWFDPIISPKFTKYIAVSKLAGESFKELTGLDYELMYNPVAIDIPKVEKYNDGKLHLISATRLTREKGLKRMQKLAKLLEDAKIEYEWLVYTNRLREPIGNHVIYKEQKLDIIEDIAKADYLVQLSDCEAFCYAIVESLMVGTPIIATDLPVLEEIGVKHGLNGVICDFNMSKVDLDLIKEKGLKFSYIPPQSDWSKYLGGKSNYDPDEIIVARAKRNIWLVEEDIHTIRNTPVKLKRWRVSELESKDLVERI